MTVSYNKLWKRLIDLNMSKTQLREKAGITTNAIAKMGKNENVSTEIICKICKVLECQVEDVIELVDEEEKEVCCIEESVLWDIYYDIIRKK